jgi:hypothetical protein
MENELGVHTYFVALLERLGFNTGVGIGLDADTGGVHGTEDIVDLADEGLVLVVDHTGEEGNALAVNHSDHLAFAGVTESSYGHHGSRGASVEAATATAEATTATAESTTATAEATASSAITAASTAKSSTSSRFKSHIVVVVVVLVNK